MPVPQHQTDPPSAELPTLPPPELRAPRAREIGETLTRLALATVWASRNPLEPFTATPAQRSSERYYFQAGDGWEGALYRRPPPPGASGEPVILAHGLLTGARGFDLGAEGSLSSALHAAGFDVYALVHRGDRDAVAPARGAGFDFDDIATWDLPAALATVQRVSGFERALWVGHALGGQLLYAHLARGGDGITAGVTLGAAVRFRRPTSSMRMAALTAQLLPAGLALPTRAVQRALSAVADAELWSPLALDLDGPTGRALLLHAGEDVPVGLVRQLARWLMSGSLVDRGDRLDYLAALQGRRFPLLCVAGSGDAICPPEAAKPAFDALDPAETSWLALDEGWGHLDLLLGRDAASTLHPQVVAWLERWRRRCW